jgi:N-acetylneuraminic acid mutarotase
MIAHKGKIYVIGGYNSNKCEYYDIENKSWNELPNLIEKERQRSMLFIENNYLYCFMGLSQAGILDTVERLNLDNTEAGWESIIVVNSNHINLKFYGSGIIRTNQSNKIYFIGGKKENKKKETVFKRTIYEFSFDNYEIAVSDFKIENDLFFVENKLYNMDENDCGNFINLGNGYLISMPILIK